MTAIAEAGHLDRAHDLMVSINDTYQRSDALALLAQQLVETGELDRAEELVQSVIDPSEQARAVAGVVEALANKG